MVVIHIGVVDVIEWYCNGNTVRIKGQGIASKAQGLMPGAIVNNP